ncbi:cobalamin biosynthesis protein CobW [Bacillus pseudomycoides]|uniref:Cobalamin biosynthesis protein CobW n=2 Tax=Bacillus pseudomycoides TaxID=64104 RepID=A0ABD6T1E4_9BACI|nr:cobalamin biosynthesis protein CobW [Bacillus pseudomycoides]PEF23761.1 cobalamin biosynthesis protein CobW [Bacillus pseudomycoides]PEO91748.1 cobalamin biosynthesis protein CobW [Bacillus pseudomycoides]PFW97775.1 cobalamin biosynthesis protein CobW [Bacillus pseudomycoides]PFX47847.1 cobalamin biosynthesis protein CobW [Bacillus pseudomycoides]
MYEMIPVTILTGFLGSGKTTLLNRILSEEHGKKLAVIVNEIGQIGIDNQLIMNVEEEIMEMTNGCLCCTVREDLLVALKQLLDVKAEGKMDFDGLVIETTGLANPGPIIQTFFLDPVIQSAYKINGVVTVVDSYHIHKHFEKGLEAKEQIAFADMVLVNKLDLVGEEEEKELLTELQGINPTAKLIPTINCEVDIPVLLEIQTFKTRDTLEIYPHKEHHHLEGVKSFVLREERPLDLQKLNEWMSAVVQELGEYLYRYKGILSIDGVDCRIVFQGVHTLFAASYDREWQEGEERVSEVVFIGKDINKEWFQEHFKECVK